MLNASKEKILSFLNGTTQYIIPFFQRGYVWKRDNWSELWENIVEEYSELSKGNTSEHFIGTIIIKQILSKNVGASEYELIDGQQRLTTLCLLLRSFYDSTSDVAAKNWIKGFFTFVDSYGHEKIRIIHSKVDKANFEKILLSADNALLWSGYKDLKYEDFYTAIEKLDSITAAYLYFRKKIEVECKDSDIRGYVNIIIDKLPVIHMALNTEDDVQQIFDTINSLGVRLTTAELLKNHLFANKNIQPLYKEYWFEIFEADEDLIEFWNRERTSGRVRRTTVELFLYSYLIIKKENTVKMESLFKEFKNYLKNKSDDELAAFAKEIAEYANIYKDIPDGENLSEFSFREDEKRFFHIVREFEITTIFPLILFIYKNINDVVQRTAILKLFESYITRRTICRLTTKNYNNTFLSILSEVKKLENITVQDFHKILYSYTEVSNRFPNDDEFVNEFSNSHLINKYSREVLFCISLHQLNHGYVDNHKLGLDGFSVEHMMPKNWVKNWRGMAEDVTPDFRKHKLLTLGNLTLIKGKLNSSLRDSAWSNKRKKLKEYSTLKITADYLDVENWNEQEIKLREDALYQIAKEIWKY